MTFPITKPTLLLDEQKCKANIQRMAEKAKRSNVEFRPHFKTHQSLEIGSWFRSEGVTKITVSSVDMAWYFARGGWTDITIAFPVNILEIEAIDKLAASVTLNVLLEAPDTTQLLDAKLKHTVNAFIKINIGNNRAGLEPDKVEDISAVIEQISRSRHIAFKGFLGHAGNSYACRNKEEILKVHAASTSQLLELKDHFRDDYPNLLLSVGDTPTCSVAEDFSMVDEIRPGVFVFFDAIMLNITCCTQRDIATTIACPIVAIHKEKNEIIIYGGRVHFASDIFTQSNGSQIFGYIVENSDNGWGNICDGVFVKKISQEHGMITAPKEFIESVSVGDLIKVIPNHICTAANLFTHYMTLDGKRISRFRF